MKDTIKTFKVCIHNTINLITKEKEKTYGDFNANGKGRKIKILNYVSKIKLAA